jgi:hypothetical protein
MLTSSCNTTISKIECDTMKSMQNMLCKLNKLNVYRIPYPVEGQADV